MYAQPPKRLKLSAQIDLPGVNGRIDHLSADLKGQRVFLAALGNRTLEVLDLKNGRRLHTIPNLAEPQGVYYDASSDRLFVACRKDGTTKLLDAGSFQVLETVKFSGDADNIRYDGRDRKSWSGTGMAPLGGSILPGKSLATFRWTPTRNRFNWKSPEPVRS